MRLPGETESTPVSVVIVNYNGRYLLGDCLDSMKEQTFREFEIILVDNASTDGSVEFVKNNYPEVKIVCNEENLGYGGGNNAGIRVAKGEYIVQLNNDTKPHQHWLQSLVEAADGDSRVGMCASKILSFDDPEIIDNTGLLMYPDGIARGRGRLERDRGQYDSQLDVFFPSGCAALYRKAMLDDIGLFDEDFFLYMDDVDIGLRGRLAGWRCVYVPEAVVYHKYSATVSPYSPMKAYLVERNRLWIVIKYFPLHMIITSFYHTFVRYLYQAYGIARGRGAGSKLARSESVFSGICLLVRAYLSAIKGSGKMLRRRRSFSRIRRITNREFRTLLRRYQLDVREIALKD